MDTPHITTPHITTPHITIEMIEALVHSLETDEATEREHLTRLINSYARIIARREPQQFRSRPRHHGDEAGHWDSSYPPAQEYSDYTGPRTIKIRSRQTEDVATSGGFYHEWRRVTTDPGLHIDARGAMWGANETGTGQFGQFAAYPGPCGVDCEIIWIRRDDVTVAELRQAEVALRALAFPLLAQHHGH